MSSQQRVVREVRTITEGGVTKQVTTETTYSSGDAMPTLQANFPEFAGGRQTKRVVTEDGKKTVYTTIEGSPSDLTKELSEKLFLDDSKSSAMATKQTAGGSKPSTSKGPSTAAPVKPDAFMKDCLEAHNKYRKKHGTPPLLLSKDLNKYAEEWAKKLAREDKFEHRPNNKFGENIYMKWSSNANYQVTGSEAVDSWYSEIKDHTFGQEPRTLASGHFTQVIWKTTKEMGIAYAKSKSGKILVVANYAPPGNLIGSFSQNVPAPRK